MSDQKIGKIEFGPAQPPGSTFPSTFTFAGLPVAPAGCTDATQPESTGTDSDPWRTAALLQDRTRRAIRERVTAGDSHASVAADYAVPVEFIVALCAWQLFADELRGERK